VSDGNGKQPARSSLIHVRVQPALRACIERDASDQSVTASAVVRKILARHYEASQRTTP
jgi:hypothetical protein